MKIVFGIIRRITPKFIKDFYCFKLPKIKTWLDKKRFELKFKKNKSKLPVLSFGEVFDLGKDKIIHGGRVKLLHLKEKFPVNDYNSNILYQVSSTQPDFEWTKICKKKGIKVVWNQNGVGYPAWAGSSYEEINIPMRRFINQADYVIYQSNFCKQSADKFLGIYHGNNCILHNCVDTESFLPITKSRDGKITQLLIAGTHNNFERVKLAIDAVSLLTKQEFQSELVIAGKFGWSQTAESEIKEYIKKLGLEKNVKIIGAYSQSKAPEIYQKSHILLHLQYNDACPTVPMEALSCGIPVIGSKSGGMPEIVLDDCGVLLNICQSYEKNYYPKAEEVAEAVKKIISNWQNYSQNARKNAVENFSKEKWLKKHEEIFNDISK